MSSPIQVALEPREELQGESGSPGPPPYKAMVSEVISLVLYQQVTWNAISQAAYPKSPWKC